MILRKLELFSSVVRVPVPVVGLTEVIYDPAQPEIVRRLVRFDAFAEALPCSDWAGMR